ncbi:heavy-metal-associated domain-containing protein [Haematospirillum sp. 15-248]|uniref:heavy-metal-associated domain-containing protein n=1 Tax=Haematospirillum sp. 15-248 TaxID=2723107 RepID=UPI0014399825|nr:heavy metal-associated domain-containing protein [Haematospirillum sp. 15-248]NKD86912.1 heavy-metal-associated domain-containing protein [Haematospirillum sp. 15-248]
MVKLTIKISGMTCTGCARTVEKAVMSIPGVNSARVDLSRQEVTFEAQEALQLSAVQQAVEQAGFDIRAD